MTALATAPTNTPAVRKPTGSQAIIQLMQERGASLAAVASKHLTPEKLVKMIGVQLAKVPKLAQCTPMSVLECAMTCAELGLSPGVLGDAYLIPYGNTCTLIVGYRGLMKLARRSGQVTTIQAEVVREGDEFHWRLGLDAALTHKPVAGIDAPMTHAWAMAKFSDGSFQFTVMRAEEVEAIRKRSRAGNNGPWITDRAEMWKKTAIRRLCKMLPLTPETEEAIAKVDETEFDFSELGKLPAAEDRPSAEGIAKELTSQVDEIETRAGDGETPVEDETPEQKARREKIVEQGKQASLEDKLAATSCSPGKKGCADSGRNVKVKGKSKYVCAAHDPENTPST